MDPVEGIARGVVTDTRHIRGGVLDALALQGAPGELAVYAPKLREWQRDGVDHQRADAVDLAPLPKQPEWVAALREDRPKLEDATLPTERVDRPDEAAVRPERHHEAGRMLRVLAEILDLQSPAGRADERMTARDLRIVDRHVSVDPSDHELRFDRKPAPGKRALLHQERGHVVTIVHPR